VDHCIGTGCAALTSFLCDSGKKPLLDSLDELHLSSLSDEHNAQPDAPDASLHELHSKVAESYKPAQSPHKTDDSKSAAHHASSAPPPAMSATAVAALTQLLHACLAQQAMPTLQDIMKDRQEKLESSGGTELQPSNAFEQLDVTVYASSVLSSKTLYRACDLTPCITSQPCDPSAPRLFQHCKKHKWVRAGTCRSSKHA
jgi:hypothetical protein